MRGRLSLESREQFFSNGLVNTNNKHQSRKVRKRFEKLDLLKVIVDTRIQS